MRRGEVYQFGFTYASGFANGGERFPEHSFPSPPAGVFNLRLVRPKIDTPRGAINDGCCLTLGARAR